MDEAQAKTRLEQALVTFGETDQYLLVYDLNERCIASRVAYHLQRFFPDHFVDVEYNRAGASPKRLHLREDCANAVDDAGEALVVPDIIVHRRGSDGPNLLGIELKKASDRRGSGCDRLRVNALKRQLGYSWGALLVCETGIPEARIFISEWI